MPWELTLLTEVLPDSCPSSPWALTALDGEMFRAVGVVVVVLKQCSFLAPDKTQKPYSLFAESLSQTRELRIKNDQD